MLFLFCSLLSLSVCVWVGGQKERLCVRFGETYALLFAAPRPCLSVVFSVFFFVCARHIVLLPSTSVCCDALFSLTLHTNTRAQYKTTVGCKKIMNELARASEPRTERKEKKHNNHKTTTRDHRKRCALRLRSRSFVRTSPNHTTYPLHAPSMPPLVARGWLF